MRSFGRGWVVVVCLTSLSFGCVGEATPRPNGEPPKNFAECVAAGGAVLKSYPGQCVTKDGLRFVDESQARARNTERACKDLCGNGRCEEMVCMAVGCPCAESHASCPTDCKE